MGRIFVTRKIPDVALEVLKASRHQVDFWPQTDVPIPRKTLLESVSGVDGLYCLISDKIDSEVVYAAGPQLKVVTTTSVGYDHIDYEELKRNKIRLGHTPDVLTDASAELTVGLLLATSRRLIEASNAAKNGTSSWNFLWLCGTSLTDKVVGIVGLGRIGQAVAKRLIPFGVKQILYTGRNKKVSAAEETGAVFSSLEDLLRNSDFVLACCALNQDTKEMFNKEAFSKMKETAIFINVSRGGVVNQDDLVEALKTKKIQAAGLDVTTPEPLPTDHPLFTLDNCVVLPHIASAEKTTRIKMAVLAANNLLAGLDDEEMPAEVK